MERFAKESNCEFDLVSTIFALVLNRLIEPMSKLSTYDWIKKEIYLHGVEQDIELHHLYRSLPARRQAGLPVGRQGLFREKGKGNRRYPLLSRFKPV